MSFYKIGIVYRIEYLENPDIRYIGSKFSEIRKRFYEHKINYNKYLNGNFSEISIYPYFKQYNIKNFKMILIKEYEVVDRTQLLAYEQLYMNKLKNINKQKSFQPLPKEQKKQHYRLNKNKIYEDNKEYYKKYRETNKEKNKEYQKKYREINKEKLKI